MFNLFWQSSASNFTFTGCTISFVDTWFNLIFDGGSLTFDNCHIGDVPSGIVSTKLKILNSVIDSKFNVKYNNNKENVKFVF